MPSHSEKTETTEKRIFVAYEIGLILKAVQAVLEVLAGVLLYLINTNKITTFILTIAHGELAEVPHDYVSRFLIRSAETLSVQGTVYICFYLVSHGVIKLFIILGLFHKKPWAYPAALIGLGSLIIYQLYRYARHHSLFLLILTIMDIIILWLIWRENKKPL